MPVLPRSGHANTGVCFREHAVSLGVFAAFLLFYALLNGRYYTIDGLTGAAFASLWVKLDHLTIFDYIKGYKNWQPVDPQAHAYVKELIRTTRYDMLIAHPIYIPLLVFGHNLLKQFSSSISFAASCQLVMSFFGALGTTLFYRMLRIAGRGITVSLLGTVILGFALSYRGYVKVDSAFFDTFTTILVLWAYFRYMKGNRRVMDVVVFALVFSVSLMFYVTPLLLLPGIFISYLCIEKDIRKLVAFIVVSFLVVYVSANVFCKYIYAYINSYYGDNVFGFSCNDFFDNLGYCYYVVDYCSNFSWGTAFLGRCGGNMINVLVPCFQNIAGLIIYAPLTLQFPIGIALVYCLVWIAIIKIRTARDPYFLAVIWVLLAILVFMVVKFVFHTKAILYLTPLMAYLAAEGVSLYATGGFRGYCAPAKIRAVIVFFFVILFGTTAYDYACPTKNLYYNWSPTSRGLLGSDVFRELNEKLPRGSVLLYDYSYVGPDLGSMICLRTDLISAYGPYFWSQSNAGEYSDFFLEYYLKMNRPKDLHILSVRGDAGVIYVPADRFLRSYLAFDRLCDIAGKWFVYRWNGKVVPKGEIIRVFKDDGPVPPDDRVHVWNDMFWKAAQVGGVRALAMVPIGAETIDGREYRKAKNIVYW